jgi:hypothetical protein
VEVDGAEFPTPADAALLLEFGDAGGLLSWTGRGLDAG